MMRKFGLVVVCALAFVVLDASLASAHVTVSPSSLPKGSDDAILTFRVPNESATAAVTGLKIQFPLAHPIVLLNPEAGTGWQVQVVKAELPKPITTDDGTFTSTDSEIDWSGGSIPVGQFGEFNVLAQGIPSRDRRARLQGDPEVQRRHSGLVDPGAEQGGARSPPSGADDHADGARWIGRHECLGRPRPRRPRQPRVRARRRTGPGAGRATPSPSPHSSWEASRSWSPCSRSGWGGRVSGSATGPAAVSRVRRAESFRPQPLTWQRAQPLEPTSRGAAR